MKLLITLFFIALSFPLFAAPAKPNIIVIITDDMGFSDIGSYGGEIETPHLDKLAAGGVKFSQFNNCAKCEPSLAFDQAAMVDAQLGSRSAQGQRYIQHPAEELFDLTADPLEENDLARDPKHSARIAEMRTRFTEIKTAAK